MDSSQLADNSRMSNSSETEEICIKEYSETYAHDSWLPDAAPYIYLSFAILGIGLNGIVVWLLCGRHMHMSRNPRLLVINQSVIDLATCVVTAVKWTTVRLPTRVPENVLGSIACHLWYSQSAVWILVNASTFNLQLITLERFMAIVRPMFRRQLWKIRLACCLAWLLGLAHQWRGLADFRRGQPDGPTAGCCVLSGLVPAQLAFAYGLLNYAVKFAFPLLNMTVCYTWMIVELRRKFKFTAQQPQQQLACRKLTASRVLIKTFTIAGVAYVLCFVANQTNFLFIAFGIIRNNFQTFFYNVTIFLVNLNSLVNPIIYFALMPKFRRALVEAAYRCCCYCCCRGRSGCVGGGGDGATSGIGGYSTGSEDWAARNNK